MTTTLSNKPTTFQAKRVSIGARFALLRPWLLSWEMYLVIIVAAALRLYMLNTTEFDDDQAAIYNMARNAAMHGYFVATSNVASVHIYNPPATIYFYMLPALFSSNPMWGAVLTGILMTLSVLLTYIFVRRAYGRFTGTIAALLFATATRAVAYSRYMWNQNLLPIIIVLFVMTLFWGVVDRRRGWLIFAIPLLGLLVQLHATGILMAAPLAVALVLAPKTIRIRDMLIGILLLLLIYAPYLYWEYTVRFADVHILLNSMHRKAIIDDKAWNFYISFLSPYPFNYNAYPLTSKLTLLSRVYPSIYHLEPALLILLISSAIVALMVVFYPFGPWPTGKRWLSIPVIGRVMGYWVQFRNNPYRCSLLILLVWQVVPLLYLSRHSLEIYAHYFIFFMPGQFILIAFLLGRLFKWFNAHGRWELFPQAMRYLAFSVAVVLILAQFVGTSANVLDYTRGNYQDGSALNNLYNSLQPLQNAVNAADQLAQSRHYSRVYLSTNWPIQSAIRYLSRQMRTPSTVFEDGPCLVLPNPADGPAVMLVGPYSPLTNALLTQYTHAILVAEPPRSGGAPFKLYIVNPSSQQAIPGNTLGNDVQQLDAPGRPFRYNGNNYLVTQWSMLRSANASYDTLYGYNFMESPTTKQYTRSLCALTSMRAGDQLLVAFHQPDNRPLPGTSTVNVRAQSYTTTPYYLKVGPLTFETYRDITSPWKLLATPQGTYDLKVLVAG